MRDREGRRRVVIEGVAPQIDCGRFPIKRTVGEEVVVEADIFADGHDLISCVLLYRPEESADWHEAPMEPLVNDRWRGRFRTFKVGRYCYTVQGWVDHFASWRRDLEKKAAADQDVSVELTAGASMIRLASQRAAGEEASQLTTAADFLAGAEQPQASRVERALDPDLARLMWEHSVRPYPARYERELQVVVDRERARFSAWYELFPRSTSPEPGRAGTFRDLEARLPYVAEMGFDVLYLPPIHPIGTSFRKGRNNAVSARPGDPGSPWGIGSPEGGHKAVHPELGSLEDFRHLVASAAEQGLEVALDVAFQVSPDHPYVAEHPEWFKKRSDGTIQYAENPPKKYQDIYPFDFESEDWKGMWEEFRSVFEFWIGQGVRIFRVDNPHTKAFPFWEWLIPELKERYPETLFLSEAFTRPRVMQRLAKLGFSQSYTYFTWRNTKQEITEYLTELTTTEVREYLRPNFWPNTPDILHEYVQHGGRPAFMARLLLAATLGANYGIYGPAYELMESVPRERGSEEYLNSEKYEVRHWDLNRSDSLRGFISRVNRARRDNPALQSNDGLVFHWVDNDQIICYSKSTPDRRNVVMAVVNLDPRWTQGGWLDTTFTRDALGLEPGQDYEVHDLLTDNRYFWHGTRNYVELNPHTMPCHLFVVRAREHKEKDFETY